MTLAEMMVAILMLGILTSLAAPSLGGMFNRNRVNDGFSELTNALREAQANAVQTSRRCIVNLDVSLSPVQIRAVNTDVPPRACIPNRTLPNGVAVATNLAGSPPQISFSFKGHTTQSGTITVYWAQQPTLQRRCLTVSNGVGIMRLGYFNSDPTNPSTGNCDTSRSGV
jgi:Tfp pilus assembly protein FimT